MTRKSPTNVVPSLPIVDHRSMLHSGIHAAVSDAFKRLMQAACAGQTPEWPVWVRPSYDGKTPCAPYIGAEAPSTDWMRVKGLTIDGWMTDRQMFNHMRDAMDNVPLWAISFRDSTGALTPCAREALEA